MKRTNLIPLCLVCVVMAGCAVPAPPSPPVVSAESVLPPKPIAPEFQGAWKGKEITPGHEGSASITVSGTKLEFHGADDNDWLKGTFTVLENTNPKQCVGVVTDCASSDYIGRKCYSIFKVEGGTLTICGNEPGDSSFPTTFDAPGTRQFVLHHEQ